MPDIRVYIQRTDGELENILICPLSVFGQCPEVGDTYVDKDAKGQPRFYSVQRRYFVNFSDTGPGWAVIIRPMEPSPPMEQMVRTWKEDDEFWSRVDRSNPEPLSSLELWRQQNEERQKFAPRQQLRSNQKRVLQLLQSHPEGLPVDSIPGAAEKTMALLAGLGLIESLSDDTTGDRIWRLSQYGKEELEREKVYLNWKPR